MALTTAGAAPTAVIYARISKDSAGDSLGVERQIKQCGELAELRGLHVADVLVENDTSAYSGKCRPQFERLVSMLRAGVIDAVIVYHSDRLYRRTTDLERLVDLIDGSGVSVHTVASGDLDLNTATGRQFARFTGVMAQGESERMGERLRAKTDELAANGNPPSGIAPYGYKRVRVQAKATDKSKTSAYAVDLAEAESLQFMARRVLEGASLLKVARELDEAQIKPRRAAKWNSTSVRLALLNPAVVALRVHRREVAGPGNWAPVLDRDTWEKVQAVLADPARKHKRPARSYLLGGLVFTELGDKMNGRLDRGAGVGQANIRHRRTYSTQYDIKNRSGPRQAQAVDAEKLEAHIVAAVLVAFDGAAFPTAEESPVSGEVEAVERQLAELAELRGRGEISLNEWMAARVPLQDRMKAAKANAAQTRRRPAKVESILQKPGALRKAWPTLAVEEQREILREVLAKVIITPATKARHTTIEERVPVETNLIWRA